MAETLERGEAASVGEGDPFEGLSPWVGEEDPFDGLLKDGSWALPVPVAPLREAAFRMLRRLYQLEGLIPELRAKLTEAVGVNEDPQLTQEDNPERWDKTLTNLLHRQRGAQDDDAQRSGTREAVEPTHRQRGRDVVDALQLLRIRRDAAYAGLVAAAADTDLQIAMAACRSAGISLEGSARTGGTGQRLWAKEDAIFDVLERAAWRRSVRAAARALARGEVDNALAQYPSLVEGGKVVLAAARAHHSVESLAAAAPEPLFVAVHEVIPELAVLGLEWFGISNLSERAGTDALGAGICALETPTGNWRACAFARQHEIEDRWLLLQLLLNRLLSDDDDEKRARSRAPALKRRRNRAAERGKKRSRAQACDGDEDG